MKTIGLLAVVGALVVLGTTLRASAAELTIDKPLGDTVVTAPKIQFEGGGMPNGAIVTVSVNGKSFKGLVVNRRWSVPDVELAVGASRAKVVIGDKTQEILVTLGADGIAPRSPQLVYFNWTSGAEEQLKALASQSLAPSPGVGDLAGFVGKVKQRVPQIFSAIYEKVANVRVVSANGPNVHEIQMMPADDSLLGLTLQDCGNAKPKQTSEIHVGTLRNHMSGRNDPNGFIVGWGPMKRSDSLDTRVEDVSQALGRTAAHEMGHALGLVGQKEGETTCVWMNGCGGDHNCEAFDHAHWGLANRYQFGWHVMDDGLNTLNNARLAERNARQRTARNPAAFEPFGASYLRIIHPFP